MNMTVLVPALSLSDSWLTTLMHHVLEGLRKSKIIPEKLGVSLTFERKMPDDDPEKEVDPNIVWIKCDKPKGFIQRGNMLLVMSTIQISISEMRPKREVVVVPNETIMTGG